MLVRTSKESVEVSPEIQIKVLFASFNNGVIGHGKDKTDQQY